MPQLVIVEGPSMGQTFEVDRVLAIGADPSNDVVLPGDGLAPRHATITRYEDAFVFRNLVDERQAHINGEPQRAIRLHHGDMISLADTVMLFSVEEPESPSEAPAKSQILSRQRLFRDAQGVVDRLGVNTSDEANRRLVALYKITALLASATNVAEMVERLLDVILEEIDADRGFILLVEEDQRSIAQRYTRDRKGHSDREAGVSRSLLAEVIRTRQGIITSRQPDEEDIASGHSLVQLGVTSTMLIPLLHQGRLEGVLGVDSLRAARAFADEDLELLTRIAIQAAAGIATMRTLIEPANFSNNLRSLGKATQWLSTYLERDAIIREAVSCSSTIFKCRRVALMLVGDDGALRLAYALGLKRSFWSDVHVSPGEGPSGRVLATGQPLLAPDPETGEPPAGLALMPDRYNSNSFAIVPIRVSAGVDGESRIVGVLCVTDKLDGRQFTRNDLQLLTILGNQTGIALTNASLYEKATVDTLTRVYVRRYFFQRLAELARKSRAQESPISLLMFDLDRFKRLNDTYGHPAGDAVLTEAGKRIKSAIRGTDVPCRYGGEEFAVILPDTDLSIAETVGERVRAAIADQPVPYQGVEHAVTISVGVAQLGPGESREGLIKRADEALYRAKEGGRDRVCVDRPAGAQ